METTGTAIMKKLSGDATAAVATGMKIAKSFEDMQKQGEKASDEAKSSNEGRNIDIERQAEANRISAEHVQAKQVQQEGFANRLNELRGGNE